MGLIVGFHNNLVIHLCNTDHEFAANVRLAAINYFIAISADPFLFQLIIRMVVVNFENAACFASCSDPYDGRSTVFFQGIWRRGCCISFALGKIVGVLICIGSMFYSAVDTNEPSDIQALRGIPGSVEQSKVKTLV